MISLMVSVGIKHHFYLLFRTTYDKQSAPARAENSAILKLPTTTIQTEFRSCVKVEVDVLASRP